MLLQFTDKGIYCAQADVFIDPWKPVARAIISHGHSDHARWGMQHYLTHHHNVPIIRHRLGPDIRVQGVAYGQETLINGVKFSLHPAGHIWGSSQIRVEYKGEVWVFSGDYKTRDDGISVPFEPVKCHTFITESTFGLPVFRFRPQQEIFADINNWWSENQALGKTSVLFGYALGKAQVLRQHVDAGIGNILLHGAVYNMQEVLRANGLDLPYTPRVTPDTPKEMLKGALIIAPPSAFGTSWMKRFTPFVTGMASGWMNLRGARRRRAADRGFVLSDHADWDELNATVALTGAERIFVTHGYTAVYAKWLRENGKEAHEVSTRFEGEQPEESELSEETTKEEVQ